MICKSKTDLYKETINLLDCLQVAIDDEKNFVFIRKKMLDLANDIMKLEVSGVDGK